MENPYIRELLLLDRQQSLLDEAARWRAVASLPVTTPRERAAAALIALALQLAPTSYQRLAVSYQPKD